LKQKEIEENTKLQKDLLAGIDLAEHDNEKLQTAPPIIAKNNFTKFLAFAWKFIDGITPLSKKVKRLQKQFDKSTGSFFVAYRFLNSLAIINLIGYSILLIRH
jgi:hypothetical protein